MDNKASLLLRNKFIKTTSMSGLLILQRPIQKDERGFFREVFHLDELEEMVGIKFSGVQVNHTHSTPGVLRGIHAERCNKVVYPLTGQAFVAIVDIRPDSPTFAKVETFNINDDNRIGLFIPNGLANSLCVTGEGTVDYIYLVDVYWDGSDTRAIAWDDPDLAIDWPIKDPILSQRDKSNPRLRDLFTDKFR